MQLGLLWAARGYPRRSLLYLLASVSFLREASAVSSNLATDMTAKNVNIGNNAASDDGETEGRRGGEEDTSDRDGEEKDSLKGQERKTKLESLLTHAFYYLAQVRTGRFYVTATIFAGGSERIRLLAPSAAGPRVPSLRLCRIWSC